MQSLKHNGIYVPPYEYKGFSVKLQGNMVRLSPRTEQMAVAWVRKAMSPISPPDKLFYKNFIQVFLDELRTENPSLNLLKDFRIKDDPPSSNGQLNESADIDFSQIKDFVKQEQEKKLNYSKEEKKQLAKERKERRDKLRANYGYAVVDGKQIEIANWTAEPSCLFAGRGDHPKRGKWKVGPREEDIILNLSPENPRPIGNWKDVIWEPEKMYLAKWEDELSGKIKYVWFSDSAFLKQEREKEKFKKAAKLGKHVPAVQEHIMRNLRSKDRVRRMTATVCWLILEVNIRVGDEKDPEEADTVGAITLRPEHIKIEGNTLHFDFLGKDAVRWVKDVEAPSEVIENIKQFSEACKEYLFEEINSKRVSRFLFERMEGLTAKVFRTWRCTKTVKEYLDKCGIKKADPEYAKQFEAKMANLQAAIVANHKRKAPAKFDERLIKKEAKLKELELKLKEKKEQGKSTETLHRRIEKSKTDLDLSVKTKEYNLGTSLKSYIDPMAYVKWAGEVDFSLGKLYPRTLRKKFYWALRGKCEID